jgi:hypothetical protein
MTAAYITAAYCSGELNPDRIKAHLSDIQQSGLTTVILFALHIGGEGEWGNFTFNKRRWLFVSQGVFNPAKDSAIRDWRQSIVELKQHGSVVKIFFSIGGWDSKDFTAIQKMLKAKQANLLRTNFNALRQAFTVDGVCVIDGFDLDKENEDIDEDTIVSFSEILFDLGFEVTLCPYQEPEWWQSCMKKLWDQNHKVSWWNLMCYAGGSNNRNDLADWIDKIAAVVGKDNKPASYLVPGLAVKTKPESDSNGQCPTDRDSIESTFAKWKDLGLRGGFLWSYDDIVKSSGAGLCPGQADDLKAYVAAINGGLSGAVGRQPPRGKPRRSPERRR